MFYYKNNEQPVQVQDGMRDCENMQFGQAYVPRQRFVELYTTDEAMRHGTVFKQLHMPYEKKK